MVKVMLPYKSGGGLPVVAVGGGDIWVSIKFQTTLALVTIKSVGFNYVMVILPYRYTWYLKQVMAWLPYIKIYFFKTLIALKLKCFRAWLKFSLIHNKTLGRYAKNWIFHQNNILQYCFSKSVHGYLTMRCVK
jgi:hypothetical protein